MALNLSGAVPAQINNTYIDPPNAQDAIGAANEGELAFRTGGLALGATALIAGATAGFVIIPQVANTPTGQPTGIPAGCTAICADVTSVTKKLWIWSGSGATWYSVTIA